MTEAGKGSKGKRITEINFNKLAELEAQDTVGTQNSSTIFHSDRQTAQDVTVLASASNLETTTSQKIKICFRIKK